MSEHEIHDVECWTFCYDRGYPRYFLPDTTSTSREGCWFNLYQWYGPLLLDHIFEAHGARLLDHEARPWADRRFRYFMRRNYGYPVKTRLTVR